MKRFTDVVGLLVLLPVSCMAADYFVSTQAEFDVAKNAVYQAGDAIWLERGSQFTGMLSPSGTGTEAKPIRIGAYGEGARPQIHAQGAHQAGVLLAGDIAYWEVEGLEVTNTDGTDEDQGNIFGILVYIDGPDNRIYRHIYIHDCYVHDVNGTVGAKQRGGIHVRMDNGLDASRLDDVRITNNRIEDVGGVGLATYSKCANVDLLENGGLYTENLWTRVYVGSNYLNRIGRNGIIIRDCKDGVVEYNVVGHTSQHDKGHNIFCFDTQGIVIQYNEAYGNVGTGEADRGGFDADYNCVDTLIQYNYSHDNEWFCGIMKKPNRNVVIRYNVSQNERQGFYFFGFENNEDCENVHIYGNTHYVSAGNDNRVAVLDRTPVNTIFENNIFYFEDAADAGYGANTDGINTVFTNNLYYNLTPHPSDGSPVTGDPLFALPGVSGVDIDLTSMNALRGYRLRAGSPAIDAASPISNSAIMDIVGTGMYGRGADMGAFEYDGSGGVTFEFLNGSVWDGGGGGGRVGSQLSLTNAVTGDIITLTTIDVIGQDGSLASDGAGHELNVVGSYLGIDDNSGNPGGYDSEWRYFNPHEGWVFSFDVDVYLEEIDLASQSADAELSLSPDSSGRMVLVSGQPNGIHFVHQYIPAGTEVTLAMTTPTNGVDTGIGISSITVSTIPNLDPIAKALVAQWTLDDASGSVATDHSGNGFHGSISNAAWVVGIDGTALRFDGSRSKLRLPADVFDGVDVEVSLAMWVHGEYSPRRADTLFYAENAAGERTLTIHMRGRDSAVYWDAGNEHGVDRIYRTGTLDLFNDAWNHWVFTKNAATGVMSIYLNGAPWHTGIDNTNHMTGVAAAVIGAAVSGENYTGLIDDVRVYIAALSAEDVSTLYNRAPRSTSGIYMTGQNVGGPAQSGSVFYSNGLYTVTGGGADIYGDADEFYYVYDNHSGDGEMTTQVLSVEETDSWAKGGIMFRESEASGAKEVMVVMRPDNQVGMQYRDTDNGSTVSLGLWGDTTSIKWIKLVRQGDLFIGSYSLDGESWTVMNLVTVGMATDVLQGLAVTSHDEADLCTAVFNMVPPSPSGVMAESVDADQVEVAWNPAVGATAYTLKRATASSGPYGLEKESIATTNTRDTGLSAGITYYYVVSAEYYGTAGDPSVEVSAVPSAWIDPEAVILVPAGTGSDGSGGMIVSLAVTNSYLGHNYRVWVAEDLHDPDWQDVTGVLSGNGGVLDIEIPVGTGMTNQFYRLGTWRQ